MPYITQQNRAFFDKEIDSLLGKLEKPGELNYVISKIVWSLFEQDQCYTHANELIGVLECAKQEFYRRQVADLENCKAIQNGDII